MGTDNLPPLNEDADDTIQSNPDQTAPYVARTERTPLIGTQRSEPTRVQRVQQARPARQTRRQPPVNRKPPASVYRPVTPTPRRPQDNSLYLPWWSLIFMLIGVLVLALLVVGLVLALGGNAPAVQPAPIIRIVTGEPTIPAADGNNAVAPLTPGTVVIAGEQAPGELQMTGPTLPPVVFSPTPQRITVGVQVQVDGVGTNQLNVRERAGRIDSDVAFLAPQGTVFNVVAGPAQADGFTWWQIQNPNNPSQTGWAASNYLIVPAEAGQ